MMQSIQQNLTLSFFILCFSCQVIAQPNKIVFKLKEDSKKSACVTTRSLCSDFETNINLPHTLNKKSFLSPSQTVPVFTAQVEEDVPQVIDNMLATGKFEYVESDFTSKPFASVVPEDVNFSKQWAFRNQGVVPNVYAKPGADMDMVKAWALQQGSSAITVAILDSGIDYNHPELVNRIWTNLSEIPDNGIDDDNNGYIDDVRGYDFGDNDNDPMDVEGHGTHVAGIIGAEAGNGIGYSGLDWNCKLMPLKVIKNNNTANYSDYAAAIYYAVDKGAKVINISLSSYKVSSVVEEAFAYAHSQGVVIVVAMSNDGNTTVHHMAKSPYSIAVGATTPSDKRASFSNFNSYIDVVAPGAYIYGLSHTDYSSSDFYMNGTSQATPMVSGLVSLLIAQNLTRSPEEIREIIKRSADDQVGPANEDIAGFDPYFGHGRINAFKALSYFYQEYTYPEPEWSNGLTDSSGCTMIFNTDFDEGAAEGWNLGSDVTISPRYGSSNSGSICITDNSGAESSLYSDPMAMADFQSISIAFNYYPVSMESGERFLIEYSIDAGITFQTLAAFISGTDFQNKEIRKESLIFNNLKFSNKTVFRFRCDASTNSDLVFIDDIRIKLCAQSENLCEVGAPCEDGNDCTTNDRINDRCECTGTVEDMDNDGVCAAEDEDDFDSCVPIATYCEGDDAPVVDLNCKVIHNESFESSGSLWQPGGTHARVERKLGRSGEYSMRIEDNEGESSAIRSVPLNLSNTEWVNVSFAFKAISMERGESFLFEVSNDNGASFTQLQEWESGKHFSNYMENDGVVNISGESLSMQTVFRFRCNASSSADGIHLDDISIEVCSGDEMIEDGVASIEDWHDAENLLPTSKSVNQSYGLQVTVYPNPAVDKIFLDHPAVSRSSLEVSIFTTDGKMVKQATVSTHRKSMIDVSELSGANTYFVSVQPTDGKVAAMTASFIKQ